MTFTAGLSSWHRCHHSPGTFVPLFFFSKPLQYSFLKTEPWLCLLSQVTQTPKANRVGDKEERAQSKRPRQREFGLVAPRPESEPSSVTAWVTLGECHALLEVQFLLLK